MEVTRRNLNGYEYTQLEQAEKETVLKQMAISHPDTPGGIVWHEWMYDYIHKEIGLEEFQKRINGGHYDN